MTTPKVIMQKVTFNLWDKMSSDNNFVTDVWKHEASAVTGHKYKEACINPQKWSNTPKPETFKQV